MVHMVHKGTRADRICIDMFCTEKGLTPVGMLGRRGRCRGEDATSCRHNGVNCRQMQARV